MKQKECVEQGTVAIKLREDKMIMELTVGMCPASVNFMIIDKKEAEDLLRKLPEIIASMEYARGGAV